MDQRVSTVRWDAIAGVVMMAIACVFLFVGSKLPFGTLTEMGPGFFPTCTAVMLLLLGALTAVEGLRGAPTLPDFPKLRPFLLIIMCPIVFASMIGWAGMVPTVVVTALLARLAEPLRPGWDLVLVPLSLAVLSVVVFIKFLGVAIPAF